MVKERNIALCIIFSIITCGIYELYWIVCLTDELNAASEENGTSGGMVLLLSIVTCGIYTWYWMYKQGEKVEIMKAKRGEMTGNTAIMYIVFAILQLGIVSVALMQNELNKVATI